MEKKTFGELLRELREAAGFATQARLAQASGLDPATVARLERDLTRPSADTIARLAAALGAPAERLFAAAGYIGKRPHTVPVLGAVRAGLPILAEENFEGELEVPADVRADFALRVEGDSMAGAGILAGDWALCRAAPTASSGQVVVALRDTGTGFAEATLKFFFHDPARGPVLRAANPAYPDVPLDGAWRIAGVMVALIRKEPPPYAFYAGYLAACDRALGAWTEVAAEAAQCGVGPREVLEIIRVQWQMAQRLAGRS